MKHVISFFYFFTSTSLINIDAHNFHFIQFEMTFLSICLSIVLPYLCYCQADVGNYRYHFNFLIPIPFINFKYDI